jgi:hypothetical protein
LFTFRKEASVVVCEVATKEPAVAKFIVSFQQLNSIPLLEAQLI